MLGDEETRLGRAHAQLGGEKGEVRLVAFLLPPVRGRLDASAPARPSGAAHGAKAATMVRRVHEPFH